MKIKHFVTLSDIYSALKFLGYSELQVDNMRLCEIVNLYKSLYPVEIELVF